MLLRNALLLDCTGDEPRERASIAIEGNPLEDIALLQNESNLKLIMKEGRTIKNELEGP